MIFDGFSLRSWYNDYLIFLLWHIEWTNQLSPMNTRFLIDSIWSSFAVIFAIAFVAWYKIITYTQLNVYHDSCCSYFKKIGTLYLSFCFYSSYISFHTWWHWKSFTMCLTSITNGSDFLLTNVILSMLPILVVLRRNSDISGYIMIKPNTKQILHISKQTHTSTHKIRNNLKRLYTPIAFQYMI